jgi:Threonine dehydrogenase and related Zn-dependent dehydrogenases
MIQAVMVSPGRIELNEVPVPETKENQVLIRICRIGVCGSDIHVYHGKHPYTSYPVVQGHELSGEIAKVGGAVHNFKPGDRVTLQPQVICGSCYPCAHGRYNICDALKVMGFQTTGAASEYFAVDAEKVLKIPDRLSFDEGAMIEPLAVAVHALQRGGEIAGKNILVLGSGTIGNLVAQAAKGLGAQAVMVTDISDYRLEKARECGADYCVNTARDSLTDALLEHFGPAKADLILECIGINPTMTQAVENARKGTDIIVVGVFGEKATVDLGLVQDRELRLIGTAMYREEDFITAIRLVEEGKIRLSNLITNHFAFKDYIKAYELIDRQKDKVMKVIINVGEDHVDESV